MKDMILAIKAKAIDLDSNVELEELENQLFELKEKIRVLECFLDLKMLE
jgi:hypothetical protein